MRLACECGNLVEKKSTLKDGSFTWNKVCRSCRGRYRYGVLKDDKCSACSFVPEVSAQLELDHIDGDRKNNHKSNIQTLCCNCHALKSFKSGDLRFKGKTNPFYKRKHSKETLEKLKLARAVQTEKSKK